MPEKNTDTTVTEISIPKDKLETMQTILSSNMMWSDKKDMLLALTGIKPLCCVCGQISSPLYQVRYSGPEYVKFEVYCSTHIESLYEKTKDKTNLEIAETYGCQLGEIDHT